MGNIEISYKNTTYNTFCDTV